MNSSASGRARRDGWSRPLPRGDPRPMIFSIKQMPNRKLPKYLLKQTVANIFATTNMTTSLGITLKSVNQFRL